jgi:long-chain fatty acid transport protein
MKRIKILALIGSILVAVAFVTPSVLAGGIELYEISTPDIGLASAGYAAGAQDASTLFKNPAGMSVLDGAQLQSGLQALYGHVHFSANSKTTTTGGNGDNAIGALPGANLFITYPVTEKLTVGFGMFSYFGLAEDYGNDWVGRYYVQKATLLGLSLMPAASFKVNNWLSIGGGLNAMYGYLDTEVALRTSILNPGPSTDGQLKLKDEEWGFGGNAGIMIQPCQGTRIGVNYLSEVKLNFSAKPSLSNPGPLASLPIFQNSLNVGMTVPQGVMVGIYQELNAKWALMADVGWQNWSRFGEVNISYDPARPGLTTQLHYDDTWHGAIGAQYTASEQWRFTAGFAYDTSAVSDANRTVTLPMGESYRFGLGTFWKVSQSVDLGAAYELAWSGDMPVNQPPSAYRGTISGSYNNAYFMFLGLNLNWHF